MKSIKNKINIDIINNIIIGIITFLIICPMKQNKILLAMMTITYIIIQLIFNKEEAIEYYIKPNLIMYPIYIWVTINIIANFIFKIPYIDAINTIACAFIMSIYLYSLKNKQALKTIRIVSILTIILANFITIIQLMINPEISRIISGSNAELVGFGIRKLFIHIWFSICSIFINRKTIFRKT